MSHRFILEPYSRASKITCPSCRHRSHTFKRYIDTETNQYLADHVGKCDCADNCGYHYPPKQFFADGNGMANRPAFTQAKPIAKHDTLPRHVVDDTTRNYQQNNFVQFLGRYLGVNVALSLAEKYQVGTSKHWSGATIFWQIDAAGKVRSGKIMLYNPMDGHRVKKPFNHVTWAHVLLGRVLGDRVTGATPPATPFNLQQSLFGEHLLNSHPFKTVAIAESEKTAIIGSYFHPKYLWLASGGLEGLSLDKCRVLHDRTVILFPDVNGYDKWKQKARQLRLRLPASQFTVDDTLERTATPEERRQGIDIADRWIDQITNTTK